MKINQDNKSCSKKFIREALLIAYHVAPSLQVLTIQGHQQHQPYLENTQVMARQPKYQNQEMRIRF